MIEVINARLLLAAGKKGGWHIPLEKIHELIILKQQVIDRMAELDPHLLDGGREAKLPHFELDFNPRGLGI